jgi:RNA polymerase sigma factor (sigma-70 family)
MWHTLSEGDACAGLGGIQKNDVFQNTVLRLVERNCAAIKKFSGTTEEEWLAYLAVITRSVVRDWLRRQRAVKRGSGMETLTLSPKGSQRPLLIWQEYQQQLPERELLGREVRNLCERTIVSLQSDSSVRDMLIFRLYFDHNLSIAQIANCRGISLSKGGVEKVINRLTDRMRSLISTDTSEAMIR